MPDCVALAIQTPVGHDRPHGRLQGRPDADRRRALRPSPASRELGARGRAGAVRATARTSSGRASPGRRRDVDRRRSRRSSPARAGKIVVAAFASSIYRMQILVDLAAQFGRKVAFVGRGMIENSQIAQRLGHLRIPTGRADPRQRRRATIPRSEVLCLTTGIQGEPIAALSRIAIDDHRHVTLGRRRRGGVLGARDPGQREGDRPGDEPPRAARRRRGRPRRASTCTCRGTAARKS